MNPKKTVLLGATENPSRYSYLAVEKLNRYNHPVIAIGKQAGRIGNTKIITEHPDEKDVDTVTLYLNPQLQKQYTIILFPFIPSGSFLIPVLRMKNYTTLLRPTE